MNGIIFIGDLMRGKINWFEIPNPFQKLDDPLVVWLIEENTKNVEIQALKSHRCSFPNEWLKNELLSNQFMRRYHFPSWVIVHGEQPEEWENLVMINLDTFQNQVTVEYNLQWSKSHVALFNYCRILVVADYNIWTENVFWCGV